MDINILKKLLKDGKSIREISRITDYSYSGIRYNIDKYNLQVKESESKERWSEENLLKALEFSSNKSDVIRNLGLKIRSGNFQTLEKYLLLYNIDTSLFFEKNMVDVVSNRKKKSKEKCFENYFIENSTTTRKVIRENVIKHNLVEYKCSGEGCSIENTWNGKPIVLQLDHINGINNDHRIENLRFLCPNCHSQTDTYSGKNRKTT